jgi:hypothetical protein
MARSEEHDYTQRMDQVKVEYIIEEGDFAIYRNDLGPTGFNIFRQC